MKTIAWENLKKITAVLTIFTQIFIPAAMAQPTLVDFQNQGIPAVIAAEDAVSSENANTLIPSSSPMMEAHSPLAAPSKDTDKDLQADDTNSAVAGKTPVAIEGPYSGPIAVGKQPVVIEGPYYGPIDVVKQPARTKTENTTDFTYDGQGNVITEIREGTNFDGSFSRVITHHAYNNGRLLETSITTTDGSAITLEERINFSYDDQGRLVQKVETKNRAGEKSKTTTDYTYDAAQGDLIMEIREGTDFNGRFTRSIAHHAYNNHQLLESSITTTDGGVITMEERIKYSYDSDGRRAQKVETKTISGKTSEITTDYTYDPSQGDLITEISEGFDNNGNFNRVITHHVHNNHQLLETSVTTTDGTSITMEERTTFSYDGEGHVLQKVENQKKITPFAEVGLDVRQEQAVGLDAVTEGIWNREYTQAFLEILGLPADAIQNVEITSVDLEKAQAAFMCMGPGCGRSYDVTVHLKDDRSFAALVGSSWDAKWSLTVFDVDGNMLGQRRGGGDTIGIILDGNGSLLPDPMPMDHASYFVAATRAGANTILNFSSLEEAKHMIGAGLEAVQAGSSASLTLTKIDGTAFEVFGMTILVAYEENENGVTVYLTDSVKRIDGSDVGLVDWAARFTAEKSSGYFDVHLMSGGTTGYNEDGSIAYQVMTDWALGEGEVVLGSYSTQTFDETGKLKSSTSMYIVGTPNEYALQPVESLPSVAMDAIAPETAAANQLVDSLGLDRDQLNQWIASGLVKTNVIRSFFGNFIDITFDSSIQGRYIAKSEINPLGSFAVPSSVFMQFDEHELPFLNYPSRMVNFSPMPDGESWFEVPTAANITHMDVKFPYAIEMGEVDGASIFVQHAAVTLDPAGQVTQVSLRDGLFPEGKIVKSISFSNLESSCPVWAPFCPGFSQTNSKTATIYYPGSLSVSKREVTFNTGLVSKSAPYDSIRSIRDYDAAGEPLSDSQFEYPAILELGAPCTVSVSGEITDCPQAGFEPHILIHRTEAVTGRQLSKIKLLEVDPSKNLSNSALITLADGKERQVFYTTLEELLNKVSKLESLNNQNSMIDWADVVIPQLTRLPAMTPENAAVSQISSSLGLEQKKLQQWMDQGLMKINVHLTDFGNFMDVTFDPILQGGFIAKSEVNPLGSFAVPSRVFMEFEEVQESGEQTLMPVMLAKGLILPERLGRTVRIFPQIVKMDIQFSNAIEMGEIDGGSIFVQHAAVTLNGAGQVTQVTLRDGTLAGGNIVKDITYSNLPGSCPAGSICMMAFNSNPKTAAILYPQSRTIIKREVVYNIADVLASEGMPYGSIRSIRDDTVDGPIVESKFIYPGNALGAPCSVNAATGEVNCPLAQHHAQIERRNADTGTLLSTITLLETDSSLNLSSSALITLANGQQRKVFYTTLEEVLEKTAALELTLDVGHGTRESVNYDPEPTPAPRGLAAAADFLKRKPFTPYVSPVLRRSERKLEHTVSGGFRPTESRKRKHASRRPVEETYEETAIHLQPLKIAGAAASDASVEAWMTQLARGGVTEKN